MCCAAWATFGDHSGHNARAARGNRLSRTPTLSFWSLRFALFGGELGAEIGQRLSEIGSAQVQQMLASAGLQCVLGEALWV